MGVEGRLSSYALLVVDLQISCVVLGVVQTLEGDQMLEGILEVVVLLGILEGVHHVEEVLVGDLLLVLEAYFVEA